MRPSEQLKQRVRRVGPQLSPQDKEMLVKFVEVIELKITALSAILKALPSPAYNTIASLLKKLSENNRAEVAKSIALILREYHVEPAERIAWTLIHHASTFPDFVAAELSALRKRDSKTVKKREKLWH